MRSIFITVSLLACSVCTLAGEDITGTWVTCYPEENRPSPYLLSSIEREGRQYVVRDEWGVAYSFSGRATRVGSKIIVRGCTYYRGERSNGCDEENPPITSRWNVRSPNAKPVSRGYALKHSIPIRTTGQAWRQVADECEEVARSFVKPQPKGRK